jgi:hypothetical protein
MPHRKPPGNVPDTKPHFEINAAHPLIARLDAELDETAFELALVLLISGQLATAVRSRIRRVCRAPEFAAGRTPRHNN